MKITRIAVLALALAAPVGVFVLLPATSALAAETQAFTPAALETAQKAGRSILVEVTAPWCPTCRAQKVILSELTTQPKFADLVILQVDFDSQKDALKMLGVRMQSTLITYKGGQEVGRSTGTTSAAAIEGQLDQSL